MLSRLNMVAILKRCRHNFSIELDTKFIRNLFREIVSTFAHLETVFSFTVIHKAVILTLRSTFKTSLLSITTVTFEVCQSVKNNQPIVFTKLKGENLV